MTELKVALEYEIDEEYYGDKMGDLAQLAVDGYLSWTRDAQEAVSSLLTDTAWEAIKGQMPSLLREQNIRVDGIPDFTSNIEWPLGAARDVCALRNDWFLEKLVVQVIESPSLSRNWPQLLL